MRSMGSDLSWRASNLVKKLDSDLYEKAIRLRQDKKLDSDLVPGGLIKL